MKSSSSEESVRKRSHSASGHSHLTMSLLSTAAQHVASSNTTTTNTCDNSLASNGVVGPIITKTSFDDVDTESNGEFTMYTRSKKIFELMKTMKTQISTNSRKMQSGHDH
jgi:hypothetical protein